MPSQQLEDLCKTLASQPPIDGVDIEATRAGLEAMVGGFPLPPDTKVEEVAVGGNLADWISTPQSDRARVALYLHGGGLTLATLLAVRDAGDTLPAAAICLSPWTDLEGIGASAQPGVVDDPMVGVEGLRAMGRVYAGDALRNPLAAPLYGDFNGLPPLLIQVGTREILLDDATRVAERAQAQGVDVTLEIEDGAPHVWQVFPGIPESIAAVERIGAFVRERVAL